MLLFMLFIEYVIFEQVYEESRRTVQVYMLKIQQQRI